MATRRDWSAEEDDLIPISALEHFSYCPRQCGLIMLEQTFDENIHTTRGQLAHQRVHEVHSESRPGVRQEFGVPIWSYRLGLIGRADVVEFTEGVPYPVEHKVGKKRSWSHEAIQLCAQALCLEEMLTTTVSRGAIYYRGSRVRREVVFDEELRALVEQAISGVRAMLASGQLPGAVADRRCRDCSLAGACLPEVVGQPGRERAWRHDLYRPLAGEVDQR